MLHPKIGRFFGPRKKILDFSAREGNIAVMLELLLIIVFFGAAIASAEYLARKD